MFSPQRNILKSAKTILLIVFVSLLHVSAVAADYTKSGALSDNLSLTISYQPEEALFKITLRNISENMLVISVEPSRFYGDIVVTTNDGQTDVYMDSVARIHRMTAGLMVSTQPMPPKAEIVWRLPVSNLRRIQDNPFDPHALQGATVHATLARVAVVPSNKTYIENNAEQTSAPIKIP